MGVRKRVTRESVYDTFPQNVNPTNEMEHFYICNAPYLHQKEKAPYGAFFFCLIRGFEADR